VAGKNVVKIKVRSLTRQPAYRRAGISFKGSEIQEIEVDEKTLKLLQADKHLKVEVLEEPKK